jgi:hypothetical protein
MERAAPMSAYLLILRSGGQYVIHQNGHQLCHSMHACSICAILCGAVDGLAL